MKKIRTLSIILMAFFSGTFLYAQTEGSQDFKLSGKDLVNLTVNQTLTQSGELLPFDRNTAEIFGLALTAGITLNNEKSLVRVILVDNDYQEYLVYEMYPLLAPGQTVSIGEECEETALLDKIKPRSLRIEIQDASVTIGSLTYASNLDSGIDVQKVRKEKHLAQGVDKINRLNKNLEKTGLFWIAGETDVSVLTYFERKKLYGQGTFPAGFEYYSGGVIQAGEKLKSATASLMVEKWDWRLRHGTSWVTGIRNQASCGSCWAFAATGATEAQVNLYYNRHLNLDLAEQDVLSCSGAGSCGGGWPSGALDYIKNTGVVDEDHFKYTYSDQPCSNKLSNPSQLIKIGGRVDFGVSPYTATEDNLKKMIIKYGPLSGGIYDWSHAMTLVGWQVVKQGDHFYTRDLNKQTYWIESVPAGSPLIGTTVWMFKNSWGNWGDAGYVYVQTAISNVGWTHAVLNPVTSLVDNYTVAYGDSDGDGYYWWGLGPKPTECPGFPQPDGDDSNAALGQLDEYGNCMILDGKPMADFSASATTIIEGGSVTFTDLSTNSPTSWSWTFAGGTPSGSTVQNPAIQYNTAGTYDVILTATNGVGSDTETKTGYIIVNSKAYCSSSGQSYVNEWIASVKFPKWTNNVATNKGYSDFTGTVRDVAAGSNSITLTPGFKKNTQFEYWRIWIDYNNNSSFEDAGELVFTASKSKTAVTGPLNVSSAAIGKTTRMRVAMKRGSVPLPCEVFANGEVEDYTISIKASFPGKGDISEEIFNESDILLYPNPANTILNIQLSGLADRTQMTIYSVIGTKVINTWLDSAYHQEDISRLKPGIYYIVVGDGSKTVRAKFIRE